MAGGRKGIAADNALDQLSGIGPKTIAALRNVGITTAAELRSIGAVGAYLRLKQADPQGITRNALWGIYGALTGIHWVEIPPEIKRQLLKEAGEGDQR